MTLDLTLDINKSSWGDQNKDGDESERESSNDESGNDESDENTNDDMRIK
jgi:hypothetical protein